MTEKYKYKILNYDNYSHLLKYKPIISKDGLIYWGKTSEGEKDRVGFEVAPSPISEQGAYQFFGTFKNGKRNGWGEINYGDIELDNGKWDNGGDNCRPLIITGIWMDGELIEKLSEELSES
uniref:MORN repeat protein n=1 Tax=Mimivirus LCMiAC02 TaxID=2506609 RepID=A0A481Z472_9VIRU|nr:MAG: hypothetical protein LCMiAC02_03010 [Mimivirus LCMiAC02]